MHARMKSCHSSPVARRTRVSMARGHVLKFACSVSTPLWTTRPKSDTPATA